MQAKSDLTTNRDIVYGASGSAKYGPGQTISAALNEEENSVHMEASVE